MNTQTDYAEVPYIDQFSVFHLDIDIWTGQSKLEKEDIKLGDGGELPPDQLAKLGRKNICDPDKLRPIRNLKTKASRLLERSGVKFLNGYAIPMKDGAGLVKELDLIKLEFEQIKQEFLNDFDSAVTEWCNKLPEYESSIRKSQTALTREGIAKKIKFDYAVFCIQPGNVNKESLVKQTLGMSDQLIADVSAECSRLINTSFLGRDKVGVNSKKTLQFLRDKIDGLSFLNGNFSTLVKLLDDAIGLYQFSEGRYVEAPHFFQIQSALLILSDEEKIKKFGNGEISFQVDFPPDSQTPLNIDSSNEKGTNEISTQNNPSSDTGSSFGPTMATSSETGESLEIDNFFGDEMPQETVAELPSEIEPVLAISDPVSEPVAQLQQVHLEIKDEDSESDVLDQTQIIPLRQEADLSAMFSSDLSADF